MDRAELERSILEDELALSRVVELLASRTPFEKWPAPLQAAFLVALHEEPSSPSERWKVLALHRHLFGAEPSAPNHAVRAATSDERRCAERLRDGLAAIVRYRAGLYLRR